LKRKNKKPVAKETLKVLIRRYKMRTNLETLQGLIKLVNLTGATCLLWKPDNLYRASIEIDGHYIGIVGTSGTIYSFLNAYLIGTEVGKKGNGQD